MERLNDNEVKEVARMQQMINSYEGFICALHMMMLSGREINFPVFTDTNLDEEMNTIWRWVREHKDNKQQKKRCTAILGLATAFSLPFLNSLPPNKRNSLIRALFRFARFQNLFHPTLA